MATVMASRQPPLPARQRSEPNTTHITYKPTSAKQFQHNVPYQSGTQNTSSNVTHIKLAHSSSVDKPAVFEPSRATPSGRRMSEPAAPPVPRRNPEQQQQANHPIRKRSIETNSFIDRNTAKIFSDPERARRPAPALPSAPETQSKTLPRSHTTSSHNDEAPPPLPGSRPPRGPPKQVQDFESRFRFHGPSEFPDPDGPTTIPKKAYPSTSIRRKEHQHSKHHEATLDPL